MIKDVTDIINIKCVFKDIDQIITNKNLKKLIDSPGIGKLYNIGEWIIDKDYKPYLLEINTTPAIEVSSNNGTPLIKEDMLDDFIKLYVLPKLKNKGPLENPEKNDWIKL